MARTVQDMLDRVGQILQDEGGIRYPTPQLIALLNDAVLEARSVRPDLFVRAFGTATPQVTGAGEAFPLPEQFFPAACYYVAGRAELRDDEFAVDGRAMTLSSIFARKLTTGV